MRAPRATATRAILCVESPMRALKPLHPAAVSRPDCV